MSVSFARLWRTIHEGGLAISSGVTASRLLRIDLGAGPQVADHDLAVVVRLEHVSSFESDLAVVAVGSDDAVDDDLVSSARGQTAPDPKLGSGQLVAIGADQLGAVSSGDDGYFCPRRFSTKLMYLSSV